MSVQQQLKDLLQNQVIPDVEDALDEIYEEINSTKNAPAELKEEVEELQDFKADLKDIVKDIDNGDIDDEEAQDIINDIKTAMTQGEE